MTDKIKDMEERSKKFWEVATEGWDTMKEVGKMILGLLVIIIATPFALIGACKRKLKK